METPRAVATCSAVPAALMISACVLMRAMCIIFNFSTSEKIMQNELTGVTQGATRGHQQENVDGLDRNND